MGRKCSCCGNMGHNSRTCNDHRGGFGGRIKLFGVQLNFCSSSLSSSSPTYFAMKRSLSTDYLPSSQTSLSTPSSSSSPSGVGGDRDSDKMCDNYLASGFIARTHERRKGVPWTEEEHRTFLKGLEKLGKGDWRGISKNFVTTRTPTQVASHAQKYFLRQKSFNKRKRSPSLPDPGRGKFRPEPVMTCFSRPSEAFSPFGFPSQTTELSSNGISCSSPLKNKNIPLSEWLSRHLSVLNWPTSSTSVDYTFPRAGPDLELKLCNPHASGANRDMRPGPPKFESSIIK